MPRPAVLVAILALVATGGFAPDRARAPTPTARPSLAIDVLARFRGAMERGEDAPAVEAIEAGAAFEGALDRIAPWELRRLNRRLGDPGLSLRLLRALDRARYRPAESHACADDLWRDYAETTIADEPATAERVLLRLCDPFEIIMVRLDRRFWPIVARHPAAFDPRRAAERRLKSLRAYAAANPALAEPLGDIAAWEATLGRDRAALQGLDRAMAESAKYDDWTEAEPWLLSNRAITAGAMGDWDRALADWRRAANIDGPGQPSTLGLAPYARALTGLGKPAEALAVMEGVEGPTPYFDLSNDEARVCALFALGRRAEAAEALARMRPRREDNPGALFRALICAGDDEVLAAEVIAWLEEPRRRGEMLMHLSQWRAPRSRTPTQQRRVAAQQRMAARPDVRAVIARVGRLERIDLTY